ncbi:MAG TPA: ATP-binding protein [Candidatus Binatia bacterium]|nr:ATP-binding protein [Candidatus Binatia bacterium]
MTLHSFVPLAAGFLNVCLAALALLRHPGSRLNRLFTYFVLAMAVWNFGAFGLRRASDASAAFFWEVIIHVGIVAVPIFYYHFVLIFLEETTAHRRSLTIGYGVMALFQVANATATPLFMPGVVQTYWGWAPATGPLYLLFFVYLYAFLIAGLVRLARARPGMTSSFRRNRATLIMLGSAIALAGGFLDLVRFIGARVFPALEQVYPAGIPANIVFTVLLGVAIIRYRMFDVSVAVKRYAAYGLAGGLITALLAGLIHAVERYLDLTGVTALWVIIPLGVVITLLLGPLGHLLEDYIERFVFSRRRGSYDTLLTLSTRMSRILDVDALMHALVHGLLRGVPLSRCALLLEDPTSRDFTVALEETADDGPGGARPIPRTSRVVEWLRQHGEVLVKDELKINPRLSDFFDGAENELEDINASLVVALKTESALVGILLIGEKLSGEIFDDQELRLLALLASQAAISFENARLYEELGETNAQLLQASRLKSQFLAGVSHELRTPLNSIIGFSKVLLNRLDGELNERQEAYVRSVHNSSQHLLQLINSILDISSIEAGRLRLEQSEFALPPLIDECVEASLPLMRGKPLRLERDVPADLPPVSGDRTRIRQVLLNLLSNAVKFTPVGRIVVRARLEGSVLHVSVADTGVGIRKEDLGRLFEPFQRLDNPVSRDVGGTGLGLAISKKFVELHGGRMWAESREAGGSTFHFTLPCVAVPVAEGSPA